MHTILVADDSVTIQKAVEIVFDKEPFQLVKAVSGAEALSRAKEVRPALVLVDHLMPDKNGYEIAEALKADAATSSIPVIILSGNTAPYDEGRARAAGVVGHVPKPFDCQTLLERVRTLLGVAATAPGAAIAAKPVEPATTGALSGMPRPPGLGGGLGGGPAGMPRPPGLGAPPPRPGVGVGVGGGVAATGAPVAAASNPPTAARQDPFGFGATVGGASTPSANPGVAASMPPRPATPASTFAGGGAASTSPPKQSEFLEVSDLEVGDVSAAGASSSPSPGASNPFGGGNGATPAVANRSTSKVDLQRLASLDAQASSAAQGGGLAAQATEHVVERASAALGAAGAAGAAGGAPSREALGEEARQIVERIAWEVVPELAEVIIREEIQRLLKAR